MIMTNIILLTGVEQSFYTGCNYAGRGSYIKQGDRTKLWDRLRDRLGLICARLGEG